MAGDRIREAVIETVYYETDHEWDEKADHGITVILHLWQETTYSDAANEKLYVLTVIGGGTISRRVLAVDTEAQAIREAIGTFDEITEIPF